MKKRLLPVLLALCLMLSGCTGGKTARDAEDTANVPMQKFTGTFYDAFDTVTQLIAYAPDQETFDQAFEAVKTAMMRYHQVFDGYNAYPGVHNLYEVNRLAGAGPAEAEKELIDLLLWVQEVQPKLQGRLNVAMGAVLSVWQSYREEGSCVPPEEMLRTAAAHADMENVVIDREKGTVQFLDPGMKLDVGAVAKGYTVEILSRMLTSVLPSYIINAGGNVRTGRKPQDGRAHWGVAIQDPGDGVNGLSSASMDILYLEDTSVVTSGDYQRYYEVDGQRYHHLIDPDTLFPGRYVRSVTVVTQDSGYADALSTALFLMPYEKGKAFADSLDGVEAYWVLNDHTVRYTDGLKGLLRSQGASGTN